MKSAPAGNRSVFQKEVVYDDLMGKNNKEG